MELMFISLPKLLTTTQAMRKWENLQVGGWGMRRTHKPDLALCTLMPDTKAVSPANVLTVVDTGVMCGKGITREGFACWASGQRGPAGSLSLGPQAREAPSGVSLLKGHRLCLPAASQARDCLCATSPAFQISTRRALWCANFTLGSAPCSHLACLWPGPPLWLPTHAHRGGKFSWRTRNLLGSPIPANISKL